MSLLAVPTAAPGPVNTTGLGRRLIGTLLSIANAALALPALLLWILTLLCFPLAPLGIGIALAYGVVWATERLTALHRWLSGKVLDEEIHPGYAPGGIAVWMRDPARWRDFAFLAYSATGGFIMSLLVVAFLAAPITYLTGLAITGSWLWLTLAMTLGPALALAWWFASLPLVRARAIVERAILGAGSAELRRRVKEVTASRSATLDHTAAEIRRIERDLHDGPQARIASVGIHLGLAEQLVATDPQAAAELLREARESTVAALGDLRSVVRGIHPPALADRGLSGAVAALAESLALPVTVSDALDHRVPAPVESAVYFAIAECLANTLKHADATHAWVTLANPDGTLHVTIGDNGAGGANPTAPGLTGLGTRLAAFDGTLTIHSPSGGPTLVTLAVPLG